MTTLQEMWTWQWSVVVFGSMTMISIWSNWRKLKKHMVMHSWMRPNIKIWRHYPVIVNTFFLFFSFITFVGDILQISLTVLKFTVITVSLTCLVYIPKKVKKALSGPLYLSHSYFSWLTLNWSLWNNTKNESFQPWNIIVNFSNNNKWKRTIKIIHTFYLDF